MRSTYSATLTRPVLSRSSAQCKPGASEQRQADQSAPLVSASRLHTSVAAASTVAHAIASSWLEMCRKKHSNPGWTLYRTKKAKTDLIHIWTLSGHGFKDRQTGLGRVRNRLNVLQGQSWSSISLFWRFNGDKAELIGNHNNGTNKKLQLNHESECADNASNI